MAPQIAFRLDAHPEIGAGHAMRCLTLANCLANQEQTISFITNANARDMAPALSRAPYKVHTLSAEVHNSPREPSAMMELCPGGCDLLVVDHYGWNADLHRACRPWAKRIMVIDDLANRHYDCDWLLDQTFGRRAQDYAPWVPAHCRLLLGTSYALLRPEFAMLRQAALAKRESTRRVQRLFVSLGAGDCDNVTGTVLDAITSLNPDLSVDVLLGAAAPHLISVREQVVRLANARLHVSTPDVAELMLQADLAIGAAGTTSWERCCLGLPTLLIVTADNQKAIADALHEHGAAITLGNSNVVRARQIQDAMSELVHDMSSWKKHSKCASEVCDGAGTMRVVDALDPVRLRRAT